VDEPKEQRAAGSDKKRVSERKRQANRENARKSTGPTSRAGKDKSKMNPVKHGILCDELIIRSGEGREDLTTFEQLLAGLRADYRPVGTLEAILVEQMAGYLWKQRRAQRHENGAIQRQIERRRNQETLQSEARFQEALATGSSLEHSARGIQHLLDSLEVVIDQVQGGGWLVDSCKFLADHFRTHILRLPAPEKVADSLPEDVDPKQLVKELKAQRARLRERLPEIEASEKDEGEARVQSYMLPEGHELDLVLRYEAALDRKLHKTMDRLGRVQADRRAAEAVTGDGVGTSQPCNDNYETNPPRQTSVRPAQTSACHRRPAFTEAGWPASSNDAAHRAQYQADSISPRSLGSEREAGWPSTVR
jgi:hypothetical protein